MDISKTIATMKQDPEFAENVGMVLIHNGTVRGCRVAITLLSARLRSLLMRIKLNRFAPRLSRWRGFSELW